MNIFTYGSLMFPDVWKAVTGALHEFQRGKINGYVRRCVQDATFPGILASGDSSDQVHGLIYLNVDPASIQLLDEFESDFYERLPVKTDSVICQAYVVPEKNATLLTERPWSPDEFEDLHLSSYLSRNFGQ